MIEASYNFPEGTIMEQTKKEGKDFYAISYSSIETTNTPFGEMPVISFSSGNYDFQIAIDTFTQTLESNGYNFETKTFN